VTFEIDLHWAYEGLGPEHFVGTPSDITDWKSVFRAASKVDLYHFEYDLAPDPVASAKNGYKFLSRIRF
jgi:hypothetical protein